MARRGESEGLSAAFVDVLSCGLGAVLLISIVFASLTQRELAQRIEDRYAIVSFTVECKDPNQSYPWAVVLDVGDPPGGAGLGSLPLMKDPLQRPGWVSYPLDGSTPVPSNLMLRFTPHQRDDVVAGTMSQPYFCRLEGLASTDLVLRMRFRSAPSGPVRIRGWIIDSVSGLRTLGAILDATVAPNLGDEMQVEADGDDLIFRSPKSRAYLVIEMED